MPKISIEKVDSLMTLLHDGLPQEKYQEIIDRFKSLTQEALDGESSDQYLPICEDFISKARDAKSRYVMWPLLGGARLLNKTRDGVRHDRLDTILNCGEAIWGTSPWDSASDPQALLTILLGLIDKSTLSLKI